MFVVFKMYNFKRLVFSVALKSSFTPPNTCRHILDIFTYSLSRRAGRPFNAGFIRVAIALQRKSGVEL